MPEIVAQMVPMLALAGLSAGWMAEAASRARGFGLLTDMAIGLSGSVLAGAITWTLIAPDAGMLTTFFIGGAGAGVALASQRGLWQAKRLAT